jgi:hypothetical protein
MVGAFVAATLKLADELETSASFKVAATGSELFYSGFRVRLVQYCMQPGVLLSRRAQKEPSIHWIEG